MQKVPPSPEGISSACDPVHTLLSPVMDGALIEENVRQNRKPSSFVENRDNLMAKLNEFS